ncbi:DUF2155 domain-containing protein [Geomonas sp. RF6]|uniref:DUF2155 domain-containing protein n=1 Tax=Geomonas sp. RF6 TaxID=2897342 RepID=UPI001E5AC466|nr:DUF2155 domain-containing protein [Geomonas sp. RF6]UFS72113.1 DUF2155 domain-containing protein [Geomonas sp. RF6]
MTRRMRLLFLPLLALIAFVGCTQKEEKNQAAPKSQQAKKESQVVVPENVKGKWKAVKIAVIDKNSGKQSVYSVPVNSEFPIPNSGLLLKVGDFLPHFVMEGTALTSRSNDPKNPAVQIRIEEGGREIFKGWLFANFPTTHAFQHPQYGFTLVGYQPA